ncbi:MAG: hypothetical protein GY866_29215 [Proteobacteria bacterium]|nr:hypothetical protein [Pseudomonadota bacterium]
MNDQQNVSIPRFFVIIALGLGILMSAFGIVSGNNPIVEPDLDQYSEDLIQNQVSGEELAKWVIKGNRNFLVAGFRTKAECKEQKKVSNVFKCHDVDKLSDNRWVRKHFKNLDLPLIVYGTGSEDGLKAAALLAHLGYSARLLEGGFNGFENNILPSEIADIDPADADEQQLNQLAVYRYFTGNDPHVKRPGQKWAMAGSDAEDEEVEEDVSEEDEEEDEEEEEEGC